MTTTHTVIVRTEQTGRAEVSISDRGQGHPFLLLHGGAGAQSVTAFADQLAAARHVRVLVPAHPGFSGTPGRKACTPSAGSPRSTSPCSTSSASMM
jgi:pimeloyl-ACP methyl ester carboxylesterase